MLLPGDDFALGHVFAVEREVYVVRAYDAHLHARFVLLFGRFFPVFVMRRVFPYLVDCLAEFGFRQ